MEEDKKKRRRERDRERYRRNRTAIRAQQKEYYESVGRQRYVNNRAVIQQRYMENRPAIQQRYIENRPAIQQRYIENRRAIQQRYIENRPAIQQRYIENRPAIQQRYIENRPAIQQRYIENRSTIQQRYIENRPAIQQYYIKNRATIREKQKAYYRERTRARTKARYAANVNRKNDDDVLEARYVPVAEVQALVRAAADGIEPPVPPPIDQSTFEAVDTRMRAELATIMAAEHACAVCAERCTADGVTRIDVLHRPAIMSAIRSRLVPPQTTSSAVIAQYKVAGFEAVMLYPPGVDGGVVTLCDTCHHSLQHPSSNNAPPPLSVAAHPIGRLDDELLADSTRVELLLTAPVRVVASIDVLRGGNRHQLQRHVQCWLNTDEKDAPPVGSLPRSVADVFTVYLKGVFSDEQRATLGKAYQVRRDVLARLVGAYKRFDNPFYEHVDGIVPADVPIGVVELEEDGAEDTDAHSHHFLDQVVGVETASGEVGTDEDAALRTTSSLLVDVSKSKASSSITLPLSSSPAVATAFGLYRSSHFASRENTITGGWPWLCPNGVGEVPSGISLGRWLRHLFSLHWRAFERDTTFCFWAFDTLARETAMKRAFITATCSSEAIRSYAEVSQSDLDVVVRVRKETFERARRGDRRQNHTVDFTPTQRVALSLVRSVENTMGEYFGSRQEKMRERQQVYAAWHHFGQPTLFGTLSMYDLGSLPLFKLSLSRTAADSEPSEYDIDSLPTVSRIFHETARNPMASARLYDAIIKKVLLRGFLGFDIEVGRSLRGGGAVGVVRHVELFTETQESGTLHAHMLVWVAGASTTFDEHERWIANEGQRRERFEAAYAAYNDSLLSTTLPVLGDAPRCPRCDGELVDWRELADLLELQQRQTRPTPATVATCTSCPNGPVRFDIETLIREHVARVVDEASSSEAAADTVQVDASDARLRWLLGGERHLAMEGYDITAESPSARFDNMTTQQRVDLTRVIVKTQGHSVGHRATCVKGRRKARPSTSATSEPAPATCRFGFPRPSAVRTTAKTEHDALTGDLRVTVTPARHPSAAYINPYNPSLVSHARNHDLRVIFGDTARAVQYTTKYVSKAQKTLENIDEVYSAAYAARLAREQLLGADAASTPVSLGLGRLISMTHRISSMQEVASPLAALYLHMGTAHITSAKHSHVFLEAAALFWLRGGLQNVDHADAAAGCDTEDAIDNDVPMADDSVNAHSAPGANDADAANDDITIRLSIAPNNMQIVPPFVDYLYRSATLSFVSYHEFACAYEVLRSNSDEHVTLHSEHPRYSTHRIRRRTEENVVPIVYSNAWPDEAEIRQLVADGKDGEATRLAERLAMLIVLLFVPWSPTAPPLRMPDGSMAATYQQRLEAFERTSEYADRAAAYVRRRQDVHRARNSANRAADARASGAADPVVNALGAMAQPEIIAASSLDNDLGEPEVAEDDAPDTRSCVAVPANASSLPYDEIVALAAAAGHVIKPVQAAGASSSTVESPLPSPLPSPRSAHVHRAALPIVAAAARSATRTYNDNEDDARAAVAAAEASADAFDAAVKLSCRPPTPPSLSAAPFESADTAEQRRRHFSMVLERLDEAAVDNCHRVYDDDKDDTLPTPNIAHPEAHATIARVSELFRLNLLQHQAFNIAAEQLIMRFRRDLRDLIGLPPLVDDAVSSSRFSMILTGSGGTGKSHVVNALRYFAASWDRPDALIVVAVSGVAASLIGGATIHSGLGLGINVSTRDDKVDDAWQLVFERTAMLLIDEFSMVDAELLARVSKRLQCALDGAQPFGGLPTLLLGDPMQLKPPVANFLFDQRRTSTRHDASLALAGHALYFDASHCIMLKEPMRSATDANYSYFLSLFRFGVFKEEHQKLLRARWLGDSSSLHAWKERVSNLPNSAFVTSAWASNAARHRATSDAFAQLQHDVPGLAVYRLPARIERSSARAAALTSTDVATMLGVGDHRCDPSTAPMLELFVGMPVACTRNLSVRFGISNGTLGFVRDIVFSDDATAHRLTTLSDQSKRIVPSSLPSVIYIDFPAYRGPRIDGLPKHFADTVVPLRPRTETVAVTLSRAAQSRAHTRRVKITQFPLIPALALIPYKLQGATVDLLVVGSLTDDTYWPPPQAAYIVFSRVRTSESIGMLCELTQKEINYFKPATCQLRELVRLHALHRTTLQRRGVEDTTPLFPPASGLDERAFAAESGVSIESKV